MKRKKTSGEAPVEGGGRAKRAAANVAVFFRKNIYIILMILCILAIAAMIVVAAVLGSQPDDMPDTPTIQVPDDDDDTPIVTPPDDDDTPTVDPEPEWTFAPELGNGKPGALGGRACVQRHGKQVENAYRHRLCRGGR